MLVDKIEWIAFEARKDTALIFCNLMRKNVHNFVTYVQSNEIIMVKLVEGYTNPAAALSCGSMLRECIRYEPLAKFVLESKYIWLFFDTYVHFTDFEIASDAFNTLKELLMMSPPQNLHISTEFLERNHDEVFEKYEVCVSYSSISNKYFA